MKRSSLALIAMMAAVPAFAGDVSASIGISQPGFYGEIHIGDYPRPAVIYAQPVVIQRPPRSVVMTPVYLRVPPGHSKHWSKHCGEYAACGRPVYFVREDWYQTQYLPRYAHQDYAARDEDRGHDRGQGQGKGHGHDDHD
jgi:hypothetical protein